MALAESVAYYSRRDTGSHNRACCGCRAALRTVAGRLGPVVSALVERYARRRSREAVKSEGVIRAAGWLSATKPGLRKVGVSNIDVEYASGQSALRQFGRNVIVESVQVRRAGAI